ncbi:MAG TPA: hypothetical protein VFC46_13635 [Humisphaera sp.]|nr:hypothetical protein [Humisphaera sp.]
MPSNAIPDSLAQYVELLRELHLLTVSGHECTAAADTVRDRMDEPWSHLDDAMIDRVRGLSADLYTIEGVPRREVPLPPIAASTSLAQQLVLAKNARDWDKALRLLRDIAPYLAPESVAHIRGTIWLELGFPSIAVLFFRYASRIAVEKTENAWIIEPVRLAH